MRNILWGNIHEIEPSFRNNQKLVLSLLRIAVVETRPNLFFRTITLISTVIGPIKKSKFSCISLNSKFAISTQ